MNMRILICMDDEKFLKYLVKKIKTFDCDEKIYLESYTRTSGISIRVQSDDFDIAYLGPVIDEKSGFDLGRTVHKNCPDCKIIYVCDDYEYMHEAFRAFAFQMLLKSQEKLLESEFYRALALYKKQHYHVLFYMENGTTHDFIPGEIVYIESTGNIVTVVTLDNRYRGYFENYLPLKQRLLEYHFFQMHPQYFVNMEHIELIRSGELIMDNNDVIPTSAMNREIIDDAIQSFMNHY